MLPMCGWMRTDPNGPIGLKVAAEEAEGAEETEGQRLWKRDAAKGGSKIAQWRHDATAMATTATVSHRRGASQHVCERAKTVAARHWLQAHM